MSTDDIVIHTNGLTKRFGENTAVDGLSMEVQRGRVYGLLGPNGSGKTTTIGMLLGLLKPTAGNFSLFGLDGHHDATLRRVGAIIETPSFYPYLSGRQNLAYFQMASGGGPRSEPDELLERVGLSGRGDDKYRNYSLGMKQRLGIAYALLGDPDLVFLDEPTNGLDPAGVIEMRDLIRSLGDGNRTVLLSSHLLHEVEQTCDSVTIISRGRLIAQGQVGTAAGLRRARAGAPAHHRRHAGAADTDGTGVGERRRRPERRHAGHGAYRPLRRDDGVAGQLGGMGHRDDAGPDVAGGLLPRGDARGRPRQRHASHRWRRRFVIGEVIRLTLAEWYKLRRRWLLWILLAVSRTDKPGVRLGPEHCLPRQ